MENYSTQISACREADGRMSLMHQICFKRRKIIHDKELFKQGLELLLKMDEELEAGRSPIEFDTICRKKR